MTTSSSEGVERHFLHRGFGLEFEMEARYIERYLPRDGRRILDVGCGIGGLFELIGKHRALGLDGLPEGLALTHGAFPDIPLIAASADRLPLRDQSIDAITAQHLVEHLSSLQFASIEWNRVLRPAGTLIIATPNQRFIDPTVYDDPSHIEIFNAQSLRSVLEHAGFDIRDIRTLGLPWFRAYGRVRGTWRLRRATLRYAYQLSELGLFRWNGQTLCCVAVKK
jgi:ubiquinone/menaquinone biosynthesis C-methylase UbiE